MKPEVKEFKTDTGDIIKTVKFGNTEFRVDNFKPKTKAEFVKIYEGSKAHKFDRNEAWEFLKQFVKKAN